MNGSDLRSLRRLKAALSCNWLGAASSDNIRDFPTPDSWGR